MNPNCAQNSQNNFTQRRQSSNSYVTAWQIESTLKNMLQFIDAIEISKTQRTQLSSVLSHALRFKKIDEQKAFVNRQLKNCTKPNLSQQKSSKNSNLAPTQNKEKYVQLSHEMKLVKSVKNRKDQMILNEKLIKSVKQTTKQTKTNLLKIRNDKKQTLIAQINSCLSSQIDTIAGKIGERQLSLNIGSERNFYESFIEEYITKSMFPKLKSSQSNTSFSQNSSIEKSFLIKCQGVKHNYSSNRIRSDYFGNSIENIQIQLGQIKSKLFTLRDQKRKITVQNLLLNKSKPNHKSQLCNFDTFIDKSKPQSKHSVRTQPKNHQEASQSIQSHKEKQSENNFFQSFISIFSGSSQSKQEASSHLPSGQMNIIHQETKKLNNSQSQIFQLNLNESMKQIEDDQAKLRMIEINSQILQLQSDIEIMVNQNIFEQIITCILKIQQINQKLCPLLNQLIQVVVIIGNQLITDNQDLSLQLSILKSPRNAQSKKLSLSKFQNEAVALKLKENQNIRFVMNMIDQNFNLRLRVTKKLFQSFQPSIKVAIKYLEKRLYEIKERYEQFVQNDIKNDKKIKATQALKSRTQVLLMNSIIETLSIQINDKIKGRLLRVNEVLEIEGKNFRNYISEKIHQVEGQKVGQNNDNSSDDILIRCQSKEIQVLESMIVRPKKQKGQIQLDKTKMGTFNLTKDTIDNEFFFFYQNLATKILNLFTQNDL